MTFMKKAAVFLAEVLGYTFLIQAAGALLFRLPLNSIVAPLEAASCLDQPYSCWLEYWLCACGGSGSKAPEALDPRTSSPPFTSADGRAECNL
jgi:hypothetical protein